MAGVCKADNTRIYFMCDFYDRFLWGGQADIYDIQRKKEGFKGLTRESI